MAADLGIGLARRARLGERAQQHQRAVVQQEREELPPERQGGIAPPRRLLGKEPPGAGDLRRGPRGMAQRREGREEGRDEGRARQRAVENRRAVGQQREGCEREGQTDRDEHPPPPADGGPEQREDREHAGLRGDARRLRPIRPLPSPAQAATATSAPPVSRSEGRGSRTGHGIARAARGRGCLRGWMRDTAPGQPGNRLSSPAQPARRAG